MLASDRRTAAPIPSGPAQGSSANDPELWPAEYPPMGEDAETPWLPSDPIPNPEPEAPGLGMPDPGIYEGATDVRPVQ